MALLNPLERQKQAYENYAKNRDNRGLGAELRSLFAAEGPEAAGTFVNIPGADFSPGGRMSAITSLADNLDFKDQDALENYLQNISERTIGRDGISIPVEGLVSDEGGFFGGGGPFLSESGQQFGFGKNEISELEKARRAIQDNAFKTDPIGNLTQKALLEKQAAESDIAAREALGEEGAFQPSGLDEITDILSSIENAEPQPPETSVEESADGIEEILKEITGSGRGEVVEKPGERKSYLESGKVSQSQIDEGFMAAMDDYIAAARGENPTGPEKKTIEKYKEEFSKATGIDVSGKVDKSSALMAFGLALLQNKAGKGFNVGKMLTSIGTAGEAAMPELAAARKEAKQAALSAGKFALEMQSSDESKRQAAAEKAMNRSSYYVMPKGEGIGGFIKNMDKAKKQRLNVFELNALITNPEFDENYEIISDASYIELAAKALEKPEATEYFTKTKSPVNLLGEGASSIFTFQAFDVNPNLGDDGPQYGKLSGGTKAGDPIYRELISSLKSLNSEDEKLANAVALAEGGSATTPEMLVNWAKGAANKLGFDVEGNTPTDQLKFFLNKLSVENAADILGESGKTLSDTDRALVKSLIGELKLLGGDNPDEIAAKLREFRTKIIVKKRNDIMGALRTLDGYTREDYSELYNDGEWSAQDDADYQRLLKKYRGKEN
jgi:hypothetical protein